MIIQCRKDKSFTEKFKEKESRIPVYAISKNGVK